MFARTQDSHDRGQHQAYGAILQPMHREHIEREFTRLLLQWHEHQNRRQLPWKGEKDPYKIWLSEIILQQTRAEQGLPYYLRFTEAFPTIYDLANAADDDVFRLWQGLGYYSRCRNLLATARQVVQEFGGSFPADYQQLLSLKGIGTYTAAAIGSFAFNLPCAVVDGNVIRVVARYLGLFEPADTTTGKRIFSAAAQNLLATDRSSAYNQAIMDFGATICVPVNPQCAICPVATHCYAKNNGAVAQLPAKTKKVAVKNRYFNYIIIEAADKVWIKQRLEKDIWQHLFEPLLIETNKPIRTADLVLHPRFLSLKTDVWPDFEGSLTQRLTHQLIDSRFFSLKAETAISSLPDGIWVDRADLHKYAFPKTVVAFFHEKAYF